MTQLTAGLFAVLRGRGRGRELRGWFPEDTSLVCSKIWESVTGDRLLSQESSLLISTVDPGCSLWQDVNAEDWTLCQIIFHHSLFIFVFINDQKKKTFAFLVFYTVKVLKLCSYNAFLIYKPCSRTKHLHLHWQEGRGTWQDRTDGGGVIIKKKYSVHMGKVLADVYMNKHTNTLNGPWESRSGLADVDFSPLLTL